MAHRAAGPRGVWPPACDPSAALSQRESWSVQPAKGVGESRRRTTRRNGARCLASRPSTAPRIATTLPRSIECVFDQRSLDAWSDRTTLRIIDPPRPVLVDWSQVDPTAGRPPGFARDPLPLRVRAGGVRVEPSMPGKQHAWVRLCDGQWRALVEVEISSANRHSRLTLTMLVAPDAIALPTSP